MKLVAAPLFIRIRRQARGPKLSQLPIFITNRLRTPRTIHHRITECAAVRCSNLPPVVKLLITVVVTRGTWGKRSSLRAKLRALVLCVTINTTNPRGLVWLDHRRHKCIRVVTSSASLLDVAGKWMTVRARTRVWCRRNCRIETELPRGVSFWNRRRRKRTRVPVSCGNWNQCDNQQRPRKKCHRPTRHQIGRRHPVELSLTSSPPTFRE